MTEVVRWDVAFAIEVIATYGPGVDYIPEPVNLPDHFGTRAVRPPVVVFAPRDSAPWRRWEGSSIQVQNLPREDPYKRAYEVAFLGKP